MNSLHRLIDQQQWTHAMIILISLFVMLTGCSSAPSHPDFGKIYNTPAQQMGDERTPVIVLPGVLGSKIVNANSGLKIWGAFTFGAADVDKPGGAREVAIPMRLGAPLSELRDDGVATEVLDYVEADIGLFRGLKLGAYVDIMRTLAVGKYRDQTLGEKGVVDYGNKHFTCFQFAYDWRRDVSENANALHQQILSAQNAVRKGRGLSPETHVKVDVLAHSMGGILLRYYLRYGTQPMPNDGTLPELNWAGAQNVQRAILVGTPNAGAAKTVVELVEGMNLNPLFPNYRAIILGTMPSAYQLLPRTRHGLVVDKDTGKRINVYNVETWIKYGWGLASRDEDKVLQWLLPDISSPEERHLIALDHLEKSLNRAEQLHRALDIPSSPPAGTELYLFAGDGIETVAGVEVDAKGNVSVTTTAPGDGTVTRASALMDERVGRQWSPGMQSPVHWSRVQFVNADHLGLCKAPAFVDNLLYLMLESPKP